MIDYATPKQKAMLINLGVPVPEGLSKKDASGLIDAAINGQMPPEPRPAQPKPSYTPKPNYGSSSKKNDTNFYVSYAKDLCIAMYEFNSGKVTDLTLDEVMQAAIIAISNAKEHFDNHGN